MTSIQPYAKFGILVSIIVCGLATACTPAGNILSTSILDLRVQQAISDYDLTPLSGNQNPNPNPAEIELGRLLFFDKVLSGNKDIACATCHHPTQNTGDGIAVSIGTGGVGLGTNRVLGYDRNFIPRNAPEIFNRGEAGWHTMFWDSRVTQTEEGQFLSPAGDLLPPGLYNALAVQAMFPVTSRDEMRGERGDFTIDGQPNALADIDDDALTAIWDTLMQRLLAIPDYADLFAHAYPDVPQNQLGFHHAANAIATFEAEAFTFIESPWSRCLTGDTGALSTAAKRGALLFYGDAQCAVCHSGPLLTDQVHHNIAVPQVGPGKGKEAPLDFGRGRETSNPADRYAFRTPSLHNVALTAPYMHNGAYRTLEAVVRHHLNPTKSLYNYDPSQHLPPDLQDTFQDDKAVLLDIVSGLDYQVIPRRVFSDAEVADIVAFLEALTDPAAIQLDVTPQAVPSGLPIQDDGA